MDLLTALVKFAAIMLVAGAAFIVIGSFIAAIPWFKRTTKPADGDPSLMFAVSGSPYGEQGHQREALEAVAILLRTVESRTRPKAAPVRRRKS